MQVDLRVLDILILRAPCQQLPWLALSKPSPQWEVLTKPIGAVLAHRIMLLLVSTLVLIAILRALVAAVAVALLLGVRRTAAVEVVKNTTFSSDI
jgi:hypothetical protein